MISSSLVFLCVACMEEVLIKLFLEYELRIVNWVYSYPVFLSRILYFYAFRMLPNIVPKRSVSLMRRSYNWFKLTVTLMHYGPKLCFYWKLLSSVQTVTLAKITLAKHNKSSLYTSDINLKGNMRVVSYCKPAKLIGRTNCDDNYLSLFTYAKGIN